MPRTTNLSRGGRAERQATPPNQHPSRRVRPILQLMRNGQGNGALVDSAPKVGAMKNRAPSPSRPAAQPLLVLLLPLPFDVDLVLLASDFRRELALELVPVELQRVLNGDLVIHDLPHGGEG